MKDKFRKGDNDNLLFVTSRCSNKCIMCCQPPSVDKDYSSLFAYNMHLIESADPDTDEICITGGEPTLIGDDLFKYMDKIWSILPKHPERNNVIPSLSRDLSTTVEMTYGH